jgi:non-specific serine/threonine protein kinase
VDVIAQMDPRPVYASGDCEIDFARRELRVRGSVVPLGGRAFEIIGVLAESAGALVTKDELMRRVWPGAVVLENTLQVHAAAVRKALGPYRALLKTESGRGYRLLGSWTVHQQAAIRQPGDRQQLNVGDGSSPTNIPASIIRLIGRAAAAQWLRDRVSAYRLVTLTGPGGIGKSTLALEVARGALGEFADGRWIVELASLSDQYLVPSALASVLGLKISGEKVSADAVARAVGQQRILLVLDNCEHVIDAVANLAELLLRMCPRTTILATSREALRVEGESVYRVSPLEAPAVEVAEPDDILRHSAVELFIARTQALESDVVSHPGDLPAIATICRRLDGIPLAIELAAARTATLGVHHVAIGLRDRFALLTSGRRSALPRHRTLRATLDWSFALLSDEEQVLLRRLAIFPGGFTLDAGAAVMTGIVPNAAAVADSIANLVTKSLIVLNESRIGTRWYLLETTRAYALEKLADSGEARHVARQQAEFCLALFAPFGTKEQLQAALDNFERYRAEVDNLRAALAWAFSPDGDTTLGVALAAAAADFWAAASLMPEACEWACHALAQIGQAAGTRHEMTLQCSFGVTRVLTRGMNDDAHKALMRALALAREFADFDYLQRATHNLWLFSFRASALDDALAVVRQFEEVAGSRDALSKVVVDCLLGVTLIYLAAHVEAIERVQRAIDRYPIESRGRDMIRFAGDMPAAAAAHIAVSFLSRGLLDTASRVAISAIDEAGGTNHPAVICVALAWAAGFIFLSLGELEIAERYGDQLSAHAVKHALRPFYVVGLCVHGSLAVRRASPSVGIQSLRRGLTEMREAGYLPFYPLFLGELAAALGALGRIDEGLAELDTAMRFAAETSHRWFMPETLRVKGELFALRDPADPAVEDCFERGTDLAREQDALFWELRLARSLARLRVAQNRYGEARQILAPVYNRFTEGFATADLQAARAMLEGLRT